VKLFGVFHSPIQDDRSAQIWLIKAEDLPEARHKFYDAMREEKIPPLTEVKEPYPHEGSYQIWEVEFREENVSPAYSLQAR